MNRVLVGRASAPGVRSTELVRLSKWVSEPYPPWAESFTAHDLARLTRRRRWVLAALAAVGGFSPRSRFQGHAIGWHRADVERWVRRVPAPADVRASGKPGRLPPAQPFTVAASIVSPKARPYEAR